MSVPKVFMIRCSRCRWAETSTGITADLQHLKEIPNDCENCGKNRKFKCPNCSSVAQMLRIKGNS